MVDYRREFIGNFRGKQETRQKRPEVRLTLDFIGFYGVLFGGQGRDRTGDTRIFSPLLYQLSYLATIVQGLNGRSAGFEPWTQ